MNGSPIYMNLEQGDGVAQFSQRSLAGMFNLGNLGGNILALALFPSSSLGVGKAVLEIVERYQAIFNGREAGLIAVTVDRNDETRLKDAPGFQVILDFDGKVGRRLGAVPIEVPPGMLKFQFRPRFILLDKRLRVLTNFELKPDGSDAVRIIPEIESLPRLAAAEPELAPPILVVPRVFTPDFSRHLIGLFETHGGIETGVIRQTGDKISVVLNRDFKCRRDYGIDDPALVATLKDLLKRRLVPEIARGFQFHATHVERHIISRYSADEKGHFRAHRDNHNLGTLHRRFAVTINLNCDYEGGDLSFPEFGSRTFRAPLGGAIVFSCSLLHAVSVMTGGVRYAYLPFFYDDAAANLLEKNRSSWTDSGDAPARAELTRL